MKQFIKYSVVAISALFVAVGCGGDSDEGGDDNSTSQAEPTAPAGAEFVYLKVDGMSWPINCAPAVQSALAKIDGVSNAKVVYKSGKATVTVEKGKVTSEQLEQAVANIQGGRYKAEAQ